MIRSALTCRPDAARAPYAVHQWLMRAWPDGEKDERMLWRRIGRDRVLVQTHARPPLWWRWCEHLADPPELREYEPRAVVGQVYRLDLLASPSKCDGASKRRLSLDTEPAAAEWLRARQERLGLELVALDVRILQRQESKRRDHEGLPPAIHARVWFTGTARCTDSAALDGAVRDGVGSGKAFGLGLLLLGGVV